MIRQISALGVIAVLAGPLAVAAFAQDRMQKPDATSQDAMKPATASHDAMKPDAMKHQDSMAHDGMKKDSMSKEASTPDATGSNKMAPK